MHNLPESCFPPEIRNLFVSLGRVGFFERSVLIGSWVMPVYQVHRGIRYALRTTDIDFAVSLAHPRARMRADLERIITDLGFTNFISTEGIQKFSAGGYEVEFLAHRPGGKDTGTTAVKEWNINAQSLPFINILIDFAEETGLDGTTIRFPLPEAFFLQKLIVSPKRASEGKRRKDLEQCAVLAPVLDDTVLQRVVQAQRFIRQTKRHIAASCGSIGFPLQRLGIFISVEEKR